MDFIGKICPYCATELQEGDDIVVCSVCEMPHHKECWIENKACTTFGCTGTMMGIDGVAVAQEDKICPKCGAASKAEKKFCGVCGTSLIEDSGHHYQVAGTPVPPAAQTYQPNAYTPQAGAAQPYQPGGYTYGQPAAPIYDNDMMMFLESEQQYYIAQFQKLQMSSTGAAWNWCSCLFGGCWFAYRKMYVAAGIHIGLSFLFSLMGTFGLLMMIALWVLSGVYGNYIYKDYVYKEVAKLKTMNEYVKGAYLAQKGGRNSNAAFAAMGILIFLLIVAAVVGG